MTGLYAGNYKSKTETGTKISYYFQGNHDSLLRNFIEIESIFSSPESSVDYIDEDGTVIFGEELRDKLVVYTAALEKAKAKEMIRYFTEVLNDQLLRIHEEDEFSTDFDVRGKIREVLQAPLERLLTEILEKCNYDNYIGSRFDEDMVDVVVVHCSEICWMR